MSDIPGQRTSVKIINGALDITERDGEKVLVLRGVVDPASLGLIKVPEYQREVLQDSKIANLKQALRKTRVPDIDLGMRGDSMLERGGAFYLQDPTYVIDGLQRMTAAGLLLVDPISPLEVHLGAMVNFNTTEPWERERFEALNLGQTKLSPNVTLANQRHKTKAVNELYQLSHSVAFAMNDKICWTQRLRKGDLITATTYFQTVGNLMGHMGPGRSKQILDLCNGLERIMIAASQEHFVRNIVTFFDVVNSCWGVRTVAYRDGAVHLRTGFLRALAVFFSDHLNYWRNTQLVIDPVTIARLAKFPIQDPYVSGLAGGSSSVNNQLLIELLGRHVSNGKRGPRLRSRKLSEGED
jgi:hypothetical protein